MSYLNSPESDSTGTKVNRGQWGFGSLKTPARVQKYLSAQHLGLCIAMFKHRQKGVKTTLTGGTGPEGKEEVTSTVQDRGANTEMSWASRNE